MTDNLRQADTCRILFRSHPAIWQIGFEQEDNAEAFLSCVLSYSDWAGFVGAYQDDPEPSIPNIIKRYILRDSRTKIFCGPDDATNEPIKLSVGDWPQFEERIRNKDRVLPYIYISPYVDSQDEEVHCKYFVDPRKLAEKMFGNALVQERNNAAVAGLVEMYGFSKPKKETCKNSRKNKNDKETQNAKDKE